MWEERLEVSPEGEMVKEWNKPEQSEKGRKGLFLAKIWQQHIRQLEWRMFLERASIMQWGHIREPGGHVTLAFRDWIGWWGLSLFGFPSRFLSQQTKNSRKDPPHWHWALCITAGMMFIQSDTCFSVLLNFLNYFYYTAVEQLLI